MSRGYSKANVPYRSLERPIVHRYKEIEEFPKALNNSQMWNWSSRMFLTEAKLNMTKELEAGQPTKYTKEELDEFEKVLKDHESWLNEWVEKQKSVKRRRNLYIPESQSCLLHSASFRKDSTAMPEGSRSGLLYPAQRLLTICLLSLSRRRRLTRTN